MSTDGGVAADVVAACAVLDGEGLTEAFGHVSAREEDGTLLVTPRVGPGLVRDAAQLLRLDADGTVVDGDPALLPGEVALHLGVYRARADVGAVVRAHGPSCLAASTALGALPAVCGVGMFCGPAVTVCDVRATVTSEAGGTEVAAALGAGAAVALRGFGQVAVGEDVRVALARAVFLERNAAALLGGAAVGGARPYAPEAVRAFLDAGAARREQIERSWTYWTARHHHDRAGATR